MSGHANQITRDAMELVRGGMSINKAALQFNMHPSTLQRACREAGITSRAPKSLPDVEKHQRVVDLWKRGLSRVQIQERTGLSKSVVFELTKGIKQGRIQSVTDLPDGGAV